VAGGRISTLARIAVPLLLAAGIWISHPLWMAAMGRYLVRAEDPATADVALVLAGDFSGNRVLAGAELVRRGFTGTVLVSGPEGLYGLNEAELAIPFAVRAGYPESWFVPLAHSALSTREEAAVAALELQRRRVRRCLLVTSDYHTRRAGGLFRAAAPGVEFRVVAAADPYFRPGGWWNTREGQKRFVLEWMKTVAGWFGL